MACVGFDKSLQRSIFPAGNDFEVLLKIIVYFEWIISTILDDKFLPYNSNS